MIHLTQFFQIFQFSPQRGGEHSGHWQWHLEKNGFSKNARRYTHYQSLLNFWFNATKTRLISEAVQILCVFEVCYFSQFCPYFSNRCYRFSILGWKGPASENVIKIRNLIPLYWSNTLKLTIFNEEFICNVLGH